MPEAGSDRLEVSLRGMLFSALVGTLPHEREIPQPVEVDVTVACDPSVLGAAHTGAANHLDYTLLHSITSDCLSSGHHRLLEDVANEISHRVLALDSVLSARVAVRKIRVALPGPLAFSEVVLERRRNA